MRDRFFLRLDPFRRDDVGWVRIVAGQQDEGEIQVSHGSLEEAAAEASGCEVVLLVPGCDVLLTHTTIPSRQRQHILRAVPYALEDQVAGDIEDMHYALGERDETGAVVVAVVSKALMRDWVNRLEAVGMEAQYVVPDWLVLPWAENRWSLFQDRHQTIVRIGSQEGLSVDAENLPQVLGAFLLDLDEPPEAMMLLGPRQQEMEKALDTAGFDVPREIQNSQAALIGLVEGFDPRSHINLAQGEFSRREQLGKLLRPWMMTAVLLGVWLLAGFAMLLGDYFRLKQQTEDIQQRIVAEYRKAFPDAKRIVDPRVQMQQKLRELRGDGGGDTVFLDLLNRVAEPLMRHGGLQIERIAYRDGRLDLALKANSLQMLEQFKQKLVTDSGLAIKIESATSRGGKVDARMTVREGEE